MPPAFTAQKRPCSRDNGCSGLLTAETSPCADSCPIGRRIGCPGKLVSNDYTDS
ncbi:MAG: hypothetical protein Q7J07_07680 [Pelolinea sp.]|nr:hypothetical protein [Pelolinea sp.]